MKIISFIILFITSIYADIGHYNFTFEGEAFNQTIRVLIKPPGVVPGIANITLNVFDQSIDSVKIQPVKWHGKITSYPHLKAGPQGSPPADLLNKVEDEESFFFGELWLMDFGAYNINIELFKGKSSEIINIPIIKNRKLKNEVCQLYSNTDYKSL